MTSDLQSQTHLNYGLSDLEDGQSILDIQHIYKFHERDEIRDVYIKTFSKIKEDHLFYLLLDMTCIYFSGADYDFTLIYHFLNPEKDQRLKVKVHLKSTDKMISFHELWSSASQLEKEVNERYGVAFFMGRGKTDLESHDSGFMSTEKSIPSLKGEIPKQSYPHFQIPLRPTPFEARLEWTSYGPHSFPLEGLGRLDLFWDKKTQVVKKAKLHHKFNERFFEKKAEQSGLFELPLLLMRSSTQNSMYYSLLYNEIIEDLTHIEIPDRAKAIRMILLELGRIDSHLNYLRKYIGLSGFQFEGESLKELQMQVLKLISTYHNRSTTFSPFLIGGVFSDIAASFINEYISINDKAQSCIDEIKRYLYRNRSFMKEGVGTKVLALQALNQAIMGPALRACGVKYDLRTTQKNYFYGDLDFKIPLGIDGTSYDRFLVHLEEVAQSFQIINQIINFIPSGPIVNNDHGYFHLSDSEEVPNMPVGECYRSIEGPEGEMGIYYLSDGGKKPGRFHLRSPSSFNLNLFHEIIDTVPVNEVFLTLQSFHIDSWELDL